MSKFVSVPTEVEAVQFDGDFAKLNRDIREQFGITFVEENDNVTRRTVDESGEHIRPVVQIWVDANSEWLTIDLGEWVIRDRHGIYPCKDDVFREKYRPMDEEADDTLEATAPDTVEEKDEFAAVLGEDELRQKLTEFLHKISRESESGTHDFVLANHMIGSLALFEESIKMRSGARLERYEFDN